MNLRAVTTAAVLGAALPVAATSALVRAASDSRDIGELRRHHTTLNLVRIGVPLVAGATYLGARLLGRGSTALTAGLFGAAAGAFFGGLLYSRVDQLAHPGETARDTAAARDSIDATRAMFERHGVAREEGLDDPFLVVDRNYPNAGYATFGPTPVEFLLLGKAPTSGVHYALAPDVVAHELSHRVIHHLAPDLEFVGEPGAIDESLADTFAAAVDGDWRIGEGVEPVRARDMSTRAHRDDYRKLPVTTDSGGRHVNAVIPNHAAYLIGSTLGTETMAGIYVAATRTLPDDATFGDLARATLDAATTLHGADSSEADVVRSAWTEIGYGDAVAGRPAG